MVQNIFILDCLYFFNFLFQSKHEYNVIHHIYVWPSFNGKTRTQIKTFERVGLMQGSFPPYLWSLQVGSGNKNDFEKFSHPAGFSGYAYKHGMWPVVRNLNLPPALLRSDDIKLYCSLYYIMCPLCQSLRAIDNPLSDLKTSQSVLECPAWNKTVCCPGYYVKFQSKPSTCAVQ